MYSQYNNGFEPEYNIQNNKNGGFFARLVKSPEYMPFRDLFITALIIGLAFVVYPLCTDIFAYGLSAVPGAYDRYINDTTFGYLCEVIYSFFCVGMPFLAVFLLLKGTGRFYGETSFEKPYNTKKTAVLIVAAVGVCFIGDYVTSYMTAIMQNMGMDFYSYQTALEGEPVPDGFYQFFAYVLRTAIVPALIEEFCFRGVILQTLRKYGDWFAIVISAVMFGLMHANMTQVPFALIAGIALGYCYVVTGSLWTTVIIHFINNFIAVAYTLVSAAYGEGAGLVFSTAASWLCIIAGIIAFVFYCVKNPYWRRLYPGVYPGQKKKAVAFFIAPTVIVGAAVLIKYMLDDIIIQ